MLRRVHRCVPKLSAWVVGAAMPLAGAMAWGDPPADDHGDVCAAATPWPIGAAWPAEPGSGALVGRLEAAGDVDWFELRLRPGYLYRLNPWAGSCGGCVRVRVVGPDCEREIARVEPFEAPGVYWFLAPPDPQGSPLPPDPGTTGGRLRACVESPAGVAVAYSVPIEVIGGPYEDDHPSTLAEAAVVSADGGEVSGTLEFGPDADVFAIEARPGAMYRLDVLSGLNDAGELTAWFGELGGSGGGGGANPQIPDALCATRPEGCGSTRVIASAGAASRLHVWIQHRVREREDLPPLSYRFRVVDEGDFAATPGGAECGGAPGIEVGEAVRSQLPNQSFTFQYWRFESRAEHVYRVRLESTVGAADLDFGVIDAECQSTLAMGEPRNGRMDAYFRDADGEPKRLFVERTVVRLDAMEQPMAGWCGLRVDDLGVVTDPEPDSYEAAAMLAIGGRLTGGDLSYGGDVDWLAGELRAGLNYRVELRVRAGVGGGGSGGGGGVVARAYFGAGSETTLRASCQTGTPASTPAHPSAWVGRDLASGVGGRLYVRLERAEPGEQGIGYELRVTRPECRADWDGSGVRDIDDVYAYIEDYFADRGEFDGQGESPGVTDVMAFVVAWIGGCG